MRDSRQAKQTLLNSSNYAAIQGRTLEKLVNRMGEAGALAHHLPARPATDHALAQAIR